MRRHMLSFATILALAAAGGAQATGSHSHHLSCSFNSDYDVQVQAGGIAFTRSSGTPATVFMHDGALQVDGRIVSVSAADSVRLRAYEEQVRELVPAVAAITRDGVEIGYSALTTVVATLSENGDDRTRLLRELREQHNEALQHIDGTLGHGIWKAGDENDLFDSHLQKTVADLVSNVTADAVKDALSGDSNRLAALQARTDALDTTLDKAVQAPADKLGQRAEALCPHFSQLEKLQQQFQFRLPGGEHLQLISPDMDRSDKASYAQR